MLRLRAVIINQVKLVQLFDSSYFINTTYYKVLVKALIQTLTQVKNTSVLSGKCSFKNTPCVKKCPFTAPV